jgi:hypothetical protein
MAVLNLNAVGESEAVIEGDLRVAFREGRRRVPKWRPNRPPSDNESQLTHPEVSACLFLLLTSAVSSVECGQIWPPLLDLVM